MTPKERAKFASRGAGCGRPLSDEDIDALREFIEVQIIAAIEEERGAILSVIAKQREEYKQLALGWAEQSGERNAHPVAKLYAHSMTVCEILEKQIRARSALIT